MLTFVSDHGFKINIHGGSSLFFGEVLPVNAPQSVFVIGIHLVTKLGGLLSHAMEAPE